VTAVTAEGDAVPELGNHIHSSTYRASAIVRRGCQHVAFEPFLFDKGHDSTSDVLVDPLGSELQLFSCLPELGFRIATLR